MINDNDFIQSHLRNVVQMLYLIDIESLTGYVNSVSRNNSLYDAMGPILDPTDYRDTLHSGKREHARTQLDIARKLLEIRKLIDALEP